MRYISKIGIEMEGGWNYSPSTEIYGDGSVSGLDGKLGEICSAPLHSLAVVMRWVEKNYPSSVNSSCGLHVHISLKSNLSYSRLMSLEFYNFFLSRVETWGKEREILSTLPFWSRLKGANSYCRKTFAPDNQANKTSKDPWRYTHLNYCFALHSTIECRVFPMFKNKSLAVEAIELFCSCVEDFLNAHKEREKVINASISAGELNEKEEKIIMEEVIDQCA